MPTLPNRLARPLSADASRLGAKEAERQASLLAVPGRVTTGFPGDGGRPILPGGGPARSSARRSPFLWWRADQ
ncbi:hypothetical protein [Roseomonas harenae]|jgi:hypothetical protein|uniref:hypothetical protein n=1 Tax=Muricoccus harenae TaxID=2692566 RepID=UPI0013319375|nr:hypothetical protein [Roseomonas harenae]